MNGFCKNKKGIATLFYNVIIGGIFIIASFFIFLYINSSLTSLKDSSITELQNIDVGISYSGLLLKLDSQNYVSFTKYLIDLTDDPSFFAAENSIQKFKTFQGALAGKKSASSLSMRYGTYLVIDYQVYPFNYMSSLNWDSKIPESCNDVHPKACSLAVDYCSFEQFYCLYKEVLP